MSDTIPTLTRHRLVKFTPCDVGRVAINSTKGGHDENEILRCVHKALGYEYYAVKRQRAPKIIDRVRIAGERLLSGVEIGAFAGFVGDFPGIAPGVGQDVAITIIESEVGVGVGIVQTSLDVLVSFLARLYAIPFVGISTALAVATALEFVIEKIEGDYDIIKVDTGKEDDPRNCKCKFKR